MTGDRREEMFPSERLADGAAPEGPLTFACPRCGDHAEAQYWGPCAACRDQLVAAAGREGRAVDVGAYEPKMNVVPNQVATKD
ncbi:MAG: hypothetical protein NVSMB16_10550 [Acidimicrobiales bacterium]